MYYTYSLQYWLNKDGINEWFSAAFDKDIERLNEMVEALRWRIINNETGAVEKHGHDEIPASDYYVQEALGEIWPSSAPK